MHRTERPPSRKIAPGRDTRCGDDKKSWWESPRGQCYVCLGACSRSQASRPLAATLGIRAGQGSTQPQEGDGAVARLADLVSCAGFSRRGGAAADTLICDGDWRGRMGVQGLKAQLELYYSPDVVTLASVRPGS